MLSEENFKKCGIKSTFFDMKDYVLCRPLFTVIIPIKTKTAEELLHIFRTRIYSVFGVCQFYSEFVTSSRLGKSLRYRLQRHNFFKNQIGEVKLFWIKNLYVWETILQLSSLT